MKYNKEALIVIDYQRWFADKSLNELYVEWGEKLAPIINELMAETKSKWWIIIASRDMHREGNISFAQNFVWKEPITEIPQWKQPDQKNFISLEEIQNWTEEKNWLTPSAGFSVAELKAYSDTLPNKTMIMWPKHCVVNTPWSEYQTWLDTSLIDIEIAKWYKQDEHPYSAAPGIEIWGKQNLEKILESHDVKKVRWVWLAEDYCVKDTLIDTAKSWKFIVELIRKATKAVNPADEVSYLSQLRQAGVKIID